MAKTYADRKSLLFETVLNPEFNLSVKETLVHTYHWYKLERLISRRRRLSKKIHKHGTKLNNDLVVFRFRRNLQDF